MAKLGGAFNAQAIPPADPDGMGGNLPVGLIPVMVVSNSIEQNANNSGSRVDITFQGIHGLGMGMQAKKRLNMWYQGSDAVKAAQARDIAAKELSALCHVTGVYDLGAEGDLDRLNGKPLIAVVESQNDAQHPERTQIVGFADVNGDKPGQPGVKVRVREAAPIQQPQPAPAQAWVPPASAPAAQAATPAAAVAFGPSSAPAPQAQPGFAPPAAAPATAPAWGGAPVVSGVVVPGAAAAPAVPDWAKR